MICGLHVVAQDGPCLQVCWGAVCVHRYLPICGLCACVHARVCVCKHLCSLF